MNNISNSLVIISNGQFQLCNLDQKPVWELGRIAANNIPDIAVNCPTVSRMHGKFHVMNGYWFYVDNTGTNGTVYNGKKVRNGYGGRKKPVMLEHGDVLVLGGSSEKFALENTVYILYTNTPWVGNWRVCNTPGLRSIRVATNSEQFVVSQLKLGQVIDTSEGLAIYMGDVTYVSGNVQIFS